MQISYKNGTITGQNIINLQDLTAATTTSTTFVNVTSQSYTPLNSINIIVFAILRVSNNTLGDGITAQLANGSTSLITQTYTQEGVASNEHTMVLVGYITGTIETASTINLNFEAVTGGTASLKIIYLSIKEY